MLVDPALTAWIQRGEGPAPAGARPTIDSPAGRFAAHERLVMARTNGLRPRGRWQTPWPTALGTPPWGAARELDQAAASPMTRYGVRVLTFDTDSTVTEWVERSVAPGTPVLVYVGSDTLPRHVVLVCTPGPGDEPRVYDPARGAVTPFPPVRPRGRAAEADGRRLWFGVAATAVPVATPTAASWARPLWSRPRWDPAG